MLMLLSDSGDEYAHGGGQIQIRSLLTFVDENPALYHYKNPANSKLLGPARMPATKGTDIVDMLVASAGVTMRPPLSEMRR